MSDRCKCGVKEGGCLVVLIPLMLFCVMLDSCSTEKRTQEMQKEMRERSQEINERLNRIEENQKKKNSDLPAEHPGK